MREMAFDLGFEIGVFSAQKRIEPSGKIIFSVSLRDKIQDRQAVFPLGKAQAAAELLEENSEAVGRTEEENRIYRGISTPSLKRSTVKIKRIVPFSSFSFALFLMVSGVSESRFMEGTPCAVI